MYLLNFFYSRASKFVRQAYLNGAKELKRDYVYNVFTVFSL